MTTPQELREWLQKMQYPNCNIQDEVLEKLCRGDMNYIFRQIIDKVKPREEIQRNKKAAIVRYILNKSSITDKLKPEQVKLYEEKVKIEKELRETKPRKENAERSLNHLISKVKAKNMKVQELRHKIKNNEKDGVLYGAKCEEIDKQLQIAQKLYEYAKTLIPSKNEQASEEISQKIRETISNLSEVIDQNKTQIAAISFEKKKQTTFSLTEPLSTTLISSARKRKTPHKYFLNSTPHNLLKTDFHNMSMLSTISSVSYASSNTELDNTQKSMKVLQDIQFNCWNDENLKKSTEELWNCGCDIIGRILTDMKKDNKQKLYDAILKRENKSIDYCNQTKIKGIDKLYSIHIENMISYYKLNMENKALQTLVEKSTANIPYLSALKMTEKGIEAMSNYLREKIKQLQEETLDSSEEILCKNISEVQRTENDIRQLKLKIDTNMTLLNNVDSWFHKIKLEIHNEMQDIQSFGDYMQQSRPDVTEFELENPFLPSYMSPAGDTIGTQYGVCSGYDLLKTDFVSRDVDNFIKCPFPSNDSCYSWSENSNPEFMELVQKSYLSPQGAITSLLREKQWLQTLETLEREDTKTSLINPISEDIDRARPLIDMRTTSVLDNMERIKQKYRKMVSRFADYESAIAFLVDAPLNNCIAPNTLHKNKRLKDYVAIYDEHFKKLK